MIQYTKSDSNIYDGILGTLSFNCRSLEYSPDKRECILSGDTNIIASKQFSKIFIDRHIIRQVDTR